MWSAGNASANAGSASVSAGRTCRRVRGSGFVSVACPSASASAGQWTDVSTDRWRVEPVDRELDLCCISGANHPSDDRYTGSLSEIFLKSSKGRSFADVRRLSDGRR